jgi:YidC/Oxa1 family membrane protein insertase
MDRNNIIGIVLIFILFMVWAQINESNSKKIKQEANAKTEMVEDSNEIADTEIAPIVQSESNDSTLPLVEKDTALMSQQLRFRFGPMATAAVGESNKVALENDLIRLVFDTKGGGIIEADVKNYEQWTSMDKKKNEITVLRLLNSDKNAFFYSLPIKGSSEGMVKTSDLFFEPEVNGNTLTLTAKAENGGYFRQIYTLSPDNYHLDYRIEVKDLGSFWSSDYKTVELYWENWLNKLEVNSNFEKTYSTVYFRPTDANPDYCSCRSDDTDNAKNKNIKWFSHANQFFNSTIIAKESFESGEFSTRMLPDEHEQLKVTSSRVQVPIHPGAPVFDMSMFVGPNEFNRLRAYGEYVEDIIPFGSSLFGTINRWIVRPLFNFLKSWIFSAGLVILALTLIVKLLLSPLTYKMLYSQSKMSALKPEMAQLKEKFKDDPQQQQVESMKLYREYGVNPLGGCMPMVLQMPIWFALYRFFPAAIEFRQKSFLWASDLSSYDVIAFLPFNIPFYGEHVSLFTLLWAVTTVAYTYYNSKMMDMNSINPAMKYMQYFMPIMFIFFFNSFAAGLSCYLFFSNVLNIGQIVVTKNFIIDHDKIRSELEKNKLKPKKKTGFGARLEEMMKQQEVMRQQQKKGNNTKK